MDRIIWFKPVRSLWDQLILNLKEYLIPKYDLLLIPSESFDKLKTIVLYLVCGLWLIDLAVHINQL